MTWAQGFADLGRAASGFALPQRGQALVFPQDHGAHPQFRIEWWYLTANLRGTDGADYGVQWTLFRSAMAPTEAPGWQSPQIWMGHAAVTSATHHRFAERLARGGIGQAGVTESPFNAYIDDWSMRSVASADLDLLDALALTARGAEFSYDLTLRATGPLALHGDAGYSVKSPTGQASHYYSQPFYEVTGRLSLPEGAVDVTGQAWLDREWSSQPLARDQTGWDWFSLHFDDGSRVMGFGLREKNGARFTSATWIAPDGTTTAYGDGALRLEPMERATVAGRDVPVRWRLILPERGLDIETAPLNPQSWMGTRFAYWEGPVQVSGSHQGAGYLEMTGYD
ncbi:putative secreted hydrolase [Puniceibacterium sp. IMCC21224]|nr:putative secreted hydrolase [Puniceibacterium sp. IMCC21224]